MKGFPPKFAPLVVLILRATPEAERVCPDCGGQGHHINHCLPSSWCKPEQPTK